MKILIKTTVVSLLFLSLFILLSKININNKAEAASNIYYVSSNGVDASGNGNSANPFKTIQYALNLAAAGDTVFVLPGTYREHLVTKNNGTKDLPITLKAEGKVILKGKDNTRILDLFNDYYIVEGFEFDGGYNDTKSVDQAIDKLLWVETGNFNKIRYNYFHHAQGECIRNLFFSEGNVFEYNTVANCGLRDFVGYRGASYKNGEGIYIGVAPEQVDPAKCKTDECRTLIAQKGLKLNDREIYTKNNIVKNNFFDTHGNECVDIKEGSSGNIIEGNVCISQYDLESAAFDTRGPRNTFIHNTVGYSDEYSQNISYGDHTSSVRETGHKILGAAFRAGGDLSGDASYNNFVKNKIIEYKGSSNVVIKVPKGDPQGAVCQNQVVALNGSFSNSGSVVNSSTCPSEYATVQQAGASSCVGHLCNVQSVTPTPTPSVYPTLVLPTATPIPIISPTFVPIPTSTPATTVFKQRVVSSSDDAEENLSRGGVDVSSVDLELVYDSSIRSNQIIGVRFQKIAIPKNAVIKNAYIDFVADVSSSSTTNLTFFAEAIDNSSSFSTSTKNISARNKTNSQVAWSSLSAWSSGKIYRTPNMSSVIQDVVNRNGWVSGNSISILITGSGQRVAKSYNRSSSLAPQLTIEYEFLPTPTISLSPTPTPVLVLTPTPSPLSSINAPQNLVGVSPSDSRVNLTWEAVTGALKYKLYWTYPGWGNIFQYKKSVTLTNTYITDAKSGQNYSFYITAVDLSGKESSKSNIVSVLVK